MKTETIPVAIAVMLTSSILGGSLKAESGPDFQFVGLVLEQGTSMTDDQALDTLGCSGHNRSPDCTGCNRLRAQRALPLAKAVLEVTYKR